jgi:hypothetical protein
MKVLGSAKSGYTVVIQLERAVLLLEVVDSSIIIPIFQPGPIMDANRCNFINSKMCLEIIAYE